MSYPLSYFYTSEAICLSLLEYDKLKNSIENNYHFLYVDKDGLSKTLLFPTIYNLKHALELLLKDMINILGENSWGHDLKKLFEDFLIQKDKSQNDLLKQVIDNQSLYNHALASMSSMLSFEDALLKLKEMVYKYYYLQIITNILGNNISLVDQDNSAARFEDSIMWKKNGINPDEIIEKITTDHFLEIHGDILLMLNIERTLTTVIKGSVFFPN